MSKKESLRAQDVLVTCKLFSRMEKRQNWTYSELALDLGLSASTVHESVDRCRCSGLLLPSRDVSLPRLHDLLAVAVPQIFYTSRGGIAHGVPTSVHASPLRNKFDVGRGNHVVVWPCADMGRQGEAVVPIYASVPGAALRDEIVYELLALADVLRVGNESEKKKAVQLLDERLLGKSSA